MTGVTRFPWFAPLLVGLLALGVRLLHLDKPADFDELYHLLAGQSWLAEGELRIADGVYERTALFTIYLAGWMALLGESLVAIRVPSVLAGAALVVVVFLWTRRVVSPSAAWIAALMLAFWRDATLISQFARFYALHALLFWLGAIALFQMVTNPPAGWAKRLALGLAAGLALGSAFYLQELTAVGLIGLAAWCALILGVRAMDRSHERARWIVLGVSGLGLVAAALLVMSDFGQELIATFRAVPAWNAALRNAVWYYHAEFVVDFPTFWPLIAVAVLVGLRRQPEATSFCATVFLVGFILHSLAASKAMRYVYWASPFLFVLWGIALADLWPSVWRFLTGMSERALTRLGLAPVRRRTVMATLALVLLVTLGAQTAVLKSIATLGDTTAGRPDWGAARAPLAPWLEEADVVLTSSELEALHYLGRFDILISKSRPAEFDAEPASSIDPRVGRLVISTPAALARIMDCFDDGLIVSSESRWRDRGQLDDALADLITRRAERFDLDARGMRAYVWAHPGGAPRPAEACDDLPMPAGARGPQ